MIEEPAEDNGPEYTEADYDQDDADYDGEPDDDDEMQMECPYCDGTGEVTTKGDSTYCLTVECAECGGTGWY